MFDSKITAEQRAATHTARVSSTNAGRPEALESPPGDGEASWLLRMFTAYSRYYVRRHFHSLRVSRSGLPEVTGGTPTVVYLNHASWWDPLVCLLLRDRYFNRGRHFAPIDAAALQRYKFFRKLGFFGVEAHSPRGAVTFLRTAGQILARAGSFLWVTPQGRFADVRERPLRFQGGLGHLAVRAPTIAFVPLAIEYVHWQERLPEVLVRFGKRVDVSDVDRSARAAEECTAKLEGVLAATQDELAEQSMGRRSEEFEVLLSGRTGVGGVYDLWRRLGSWRRGKPFDARHGHS